MGAKRFSFDADPSKIVEQVIGGVSEFKLFYFCKYRTSDELKQIVHGQFAAELSNRRGKSTEVRDYRVSSDASTNQLIVSCPTREDAEAVLEVLLVVDVPSFAVKRPTFYFGNPRAFDFDKTRSQDAELTNGRITLTVDKKTGAIVNLKWKKLSVDLVNRKNRLGLNDYFYVAGRDPKDPQRNGPVRFRAKEWGPLVTSLLIESDAPGCNKLTREVSLIAGLDRVDITNVIDKQKIYQPEAVHLAFAFNVPDGVMRMDIPWAVVRPEVDQLRGACKNYFTVQRWVDVSNDDYGVTWATVDAPLVEVGAITADPRAIGWIEHIEPSTTLYSYVMNNYWETNYKAGQEGPTTFRYSIMPHKRFDSAEASKFGIERSQPLVAVPVDDNTALGKSVLRVEPSGVILTAFKPAEGSRKAGSQTGGVWIARLFNATGQPAEARLTWAKPAQRSVTRRSSLGTRATDHGRRVAMAPYEIVTLRVPLD